MLLDVTDCHQVLVTSRGAHRFFPFGGSRVLQVRLRTSRAEPRGPRGNGLGGAQSGHLHGVRRDGAAAHQASLGGVCRLTPDPFCSARSFWEGGGRVFGPVEKKNGGQVSGVWVPEKLVSINLKRPIH